MILIKITVPSTSEVIYVSDVGIRAKENSGTKTKVFWYPYIAVGGLGDIAYRMDTPHGGMVRISGLGTLKLNPSFVSGSAPLKLNLDIRYYHSDTKVQDQLVFATAYLKRIKSYEVEYTLYDYEWDVDLLDDAPDLGDETGRVYPLVIGSVTLEKPLRVGTTSNYQYWKAGISGTDPSISGGDYSVYDDGRRKDGFAGGGYGTIVNHTDYFESVLSVDGLIPNKPYGDIRMSGTNEDIGTLQELFGWAVDRFNTALGLSYTLDISKARTVSPNLHYYAFEQIKLMDFLSNVCAATAHCFYIDRISGTFYLIDLKKDNGSLELSSSDGKAFTDFFSAEYEYPDPVKYIVHKWMLYEADLDADGYPIFSEINYSQDYTTGNNFIRELTIDDLYTNVLSEIKTRLIDICRLEQAPISDVTVPYDIDIPVPGKKYSWTDSGMNISSSISIRARDITFNPLDLETKITGFAFSDSW
jgi:hypothetical protein